MNATAVLAAALLGSALAVAAEPTPVKPSNDPALRDPSLDRDAERLKRTADQPTTPALTPEGHEATEGMGLKDPRPNPGSLIREGAFLTDRRGRLLPMQRGGWIFVFDPDAEGKAESPMPIQPCQRLSEMQRTMESKTGTVTFLVSGTVQVFDGVNYFLPRDFSTIASEEAMAPVRKPAPSVPGQKSADPTASELLKQIDTGGPAKQGGAAGAVGEEANGHKNAPGKAAKNEESKVIREGTIIVSRRARVERGGESGWVAVFDNDTDKPNDKRSSMGLMRCANLESIAALAGPGRRGMTFTFSGTVYTYAGRNYLLPTFYSVQAEREGNVVSGQ
ncbi:MAG TPA: hypothetical protein VG797_07215 [Phycisphaerales bacterium]|nr:hypothetical protein [Phycisphaerales bacterium]